MTSAIVTFFKVRKIWPILGFLKEAWQFSLALTCSANLCPVTVRDYPKFSPQMYYFPQPGGLLVPTMSVRNDEEFWSICLKDHFRNPVRLA